MGKRRVPKRTVGEPRPKRGPSTRTRAAESRDLLRPLVATEILARAAPPWILIDRRLRVIDRGGRTGPDRDLLERARQIASSPASSPARSPHGGDRLGPALRDAVAEAARLGRPVDRTVSAASGVVGLVVVPIATSGGGPPHFLVLLDQPIGGPWSGPEPGAPAPGARHREDRDQRPAAGGHAALDRAADLLDAVPVPLVLLDQRMRVRAANCAFRDALAGGEEILGAAWFELDGGLWDRPGMRALIREVRGGARPIEGDLELDIEVPGGRRRTLAVSGSSLGGDGGARLILLGLVDVTERAERLRAASGAREEAERANRTKDVFLATLSHELRAPLHSLTLHADLLLTGAPPGPAKVRRIGNAIRRSIGTQTRIVGDLLDVSAILAGKLAIKRQPVDMPAVVGAAVGDLRAAARARQLRLRVALDRTAGPVVGDQTRLQQVVANLLANAIKFTPAGGRIAVALQASRAAVRIRVSDTGQGISADLLPHVFDRFVQADSGASGHGGLGLGLAIVRDLVRLHRGEVRAESDGLGRGATFTVELPTRAASAAAGDRQPRARRSTARAVPIVAEPAPDRADPRRDHLKGIRVLVVEDDPGSRSALTDTLRLRSAEVRAVGSAAEMMDALAAFRPDVLLCDVAMQGEDGYSLMRRVRALGPDRGGQTPAVALTGLATRQDRRRALTAGFHMHVPTPAPAAVLCAAVREVSRARREGRGS